MPILAGLLLTFSLLIVMVMREAYIGWPLALGYLYFVCLGRVKGYSAKEIWVMSKAGAQKAFIVVPILLLIGCVVAIWMASGTVGALVYYALSLISPPLFIFFAFILCCLISMLLGTSFGTAGTIGVILMVLARSGGVDPYITAGAIISGIYVGDRCSPMSSAIYLLSSVTNTKAATNIVMSIKTTLIPCALCAALYFVVSINNPLLTEDTPLREHILQTFYIGPVTFIPAIIIIVLSCFKVKAKTSMLASALCAAAIAVFAQGLAFNQLFTTLMWGYHPGEENALAGIIQGGGMWGMIKTGFILLAACSLTGVLEGLGALEGLEKLLLKPCGRFMLYLRTMAVAVLGICCGCNQSIAIVITGQLMKRPYEQAGLDNYALARDISYTALPLAAIIPWSVAASVPMATLGIERPEHLPYLFFPLVIALYYGAVYAWQGRKATHTQTLT